MMARAFALFISLLTLVNLLGDALWPGFDASIWWISFGPLPVWLSHPLLAAAALCFLVFALVQADPAQRSPWTAFLALLLAVVAFANGLGYYRLLAGGGIARGLPVSFSLLICLGLLLVARAAWRGRQAQTRFGRGLIGLGGCGLFVLFPLALMLFFGNTDYRRPADVAVVFGARAYRDGRLSDALEDRMRTACELYHQGLVRRLVLSGGPGDGAVSEAQAMRRYALNHGVKSEDIFLDEEGLNTEATVCNTVSLLRQWHAGRVLAVSHFYHLPRIKLAFERAGVDVCTVPARQGHVLGQLPFNMVREVAAFWTYYLKQKPATPAS